MIVIEVTKDFHSGHLHGLSIPAYLENEKLVIGFNGEYKHKKFIFNYRAEDIKFFCNHQYKDEDKNIPHYIFNKVPYGLFELSSHEEPDKLLYTVLVPCPEGTFFCQCEKCGTNFIIELTDSLYYRKNNIEIPTIRCKDCMF